MSVLRFQNFLFIYLFSFLFFLSCSDKSKQKTDADETSDSLHVVFVTGDEEYRSEESMPMLAKLVKRELGAKVTVCYSLDSTGIIDPNRLDHIDNLKALETADLMVIFARYRALPEEERNYIVNYVESGKPIVGFRTSTHTFKYLNDSSLFYWNDEWPTKVFGQQWITHHGHFDDGQKPLTKITAIEGATSPILNGFDSVNTYSWLYHVDGGDWKLQSDCRPILMGQSLKSKHEIDGNLDKFPITNPVAWTKTYTGNSGIAARVFFTTLGHPFDFTIPEIRRLALNGIFWALGKEDEIPASGVNATLDEPYEPSNSGFGDRYKKNQKPKKI
jgi:type 1 glutamine amidotransferase